MNQFPVNYSHTPKYAGAKQPGMTGQVKEEILTRFGELGLLVKDGKISFKPSLLKTTEFLSAAEEFQFIDIAGEHKTIELSAASLGFTYCQVPFVYNNSTTGVAKVELILANGEVMQSDLLEMNTKLSAQIFSRSGEINQVNVSVPTDMLLAG